MSFEKVLVACTRMKTLLEKIVPAFFFAPEPLLSFSFANNDLRCFEQGVKTIRRKTCIISPS